MDPAETDLGTSPTGVGGRAVVAVLVVALIWNLVGNLLLPGALYVPANLAVAALLVLLARRAGVGWEALGLRRDRVDQKRGGGKRREPESANAPARRSRQCSHRSPLPLLEACTQIRQV